jgi:hypothetical protein
MRRRLLGFEPLEDRRLLALVTWDGGGGDDRWENAANWTGDAVPGATDDAQIDVTGSLRTIVIDTTSVTVRSLNSQENLQVKGTGNFSIDSQAALGTTSIIAGGLLLAPSRSLTVAGSGTNVQFVGVSNIDGGSLLVSAGGSLDLPGVASYTKSSVDGTDSLLQANGAGSVIEMRNLLNITVNFDSNIIVNATGGGTVNLSKLDTVTFPGDQRGQAIHFTSTGTDTASGKRSRIDLSSLVSLLDPSSAGTRYVNNGTSSLNALNNGEINTPLLESVSTTDIQLDATGIMDLSRLKSAVSSTLSFRSAPRSLPVFANASQSWISVTDGQVLVPMLTNIDSTSFTLNGTTTLSVPATSASDIGGTPARRAGFGQVIFEVNGPGAILELSKLQSITTAYDSNIIVNATGGGTVNLSKLDTVNFPGDQGGQAIRFTSTGMDAASGKRSRIDLSSLVNLLDSSPGTTRYEDNGSSALSALNNGEIITPRLESVSTTRIQLDATGRLLINAATLSASNSSLSVSGGATLLYGLSLSNSSYLTGDFGINGDLSVAASTIEPNSRIVVRGNLRLDDKSQIVVNVGAQSPNRLFGRQSHQNGKLQDAWWYS